MPIVKVNSIIHLLHLMLICGPHFILTHLSYMKHVTSSPWQTANTTKQLYIRIKSLDEITYLAYKNICAYTFTKKIRG